MACETVEPLDFDESLVAAFERAAVTFSSRIALGSDVWEPTYRGLNETANRLAHRLIASGGALGDRAAILMSHDAPMVSAVLGVLKAGQIVVALNPDDPVSRLKMIVEDAEPSVIVVDSQHCKLANEFARPDCRIITFEPKTATGPAENPSLKILPEQTAFLTYTSGTTGRPKGVMKTHRQLRRGAAVHSEAMRYTENDRIPLFAMVSTGQGATALWFLLNGATLFPFSLKTRGVTGLSDWIIHRGLTVYVSSASIFRTLVKTNDDRPAFANVRAVQLASEAVTADDFRAFRTNFPAASIFVHGLSSSETSNIAWSRWAQNDDIPEGVLPVGHFSRDVSLLGDNGQPVARGDIGEIVVRSRYVANGYWRNPELTAEVEEIVIPADMRQFKNVCPDIGEQHLRFRSRFFTIAIVANGKCILSKHLAIDLIAPVVGEIVQKHDSRRHHVARQICSYGVSQTLRRPRRIARFDDKCDQHLLVISAADSNDSSAIDAWKPL